MAPALLESEVVGMLVMAARDAREQAYAPYSGFKVGAVVLTAANRLFLGCNVENASYGLTICAERTALVAAIADGCRDLKALAVVADTDTPVSPCGACRQVMVELGGRGLIVIRANLRGELTTTTAGGLLPESFSLLAHPGPKGSP